MSSYWECPYCNRAQVITSPKLRKGLVDLRISDQAEGPLCGSFLAVGCSNPECLKTTVKAVVMNASTEAGVYYAREGAEIINMFLMPSSNAKPQPDYIPEPIREDYYEACKIRDLSPKASATLIRRCLQGMIRDFAGIKKNSLNNEITALKDAITDRTADHSITPESVEAIDHIRTIGNIGAHMEKDINTIIDVDPDEASTLIEVTEMLFEEWYGDRHRRRERLAKVKGIADSKKDQKALPTPS